MPKPKPKGKGGRASGDVAMGTRSYDLQGCKTRWLIDATVRSHAPSPFDARRCTLCAPNPLLTWAWTLQRIGNVSRLISRRDDGDAHLTTLEFSSSGLLSEDIAPNRVALVASKDIDAGEELVWS